MPRARRSQTTPPATLSTKVNSNKELPQSAACLSPVSPPQQSSPLTNEHFTVQNCSDVALVTSATVYSQNTSSPSEPVISANQFSELNSIKININNRKTSEPNCVTTNIASDTIKMAPKRGSMKIESYAKTNANVNKKDDGEKEEKELRKASQEMNRASKRIIKQTFTSNVLEIEPENHENINGKNKKIVNPEEDDWEAMFDDNGDCLDPKMLDELTAQVGKVTIEKPKTDYKV